MLRCHRATRSGECGTNRGGWSCALPQGTGGGDEEEEEEGGASRQPGRLLFTPQTSVSYFWHLQNKKNHREID